MAVAGSLGRMVAKGKSLLLLLPLLPLRLLRLLRLLGITGSPFNGCRGMIAGVDACWEESNCVGLGTRMARLVVVSAKMGAGVGTGRGMGAGLGGGVGLGMGLEIGGGVGLGLGAGNGGGVDPVEVLGG